jgi:hypothetical protein
MKSFIISVVVVFVMAMALGFVVHGMLLHTDYGQIPNVMRTDADGQKHMPFMMLGQLCFAIAFVWIYQHGKEDKPAVAQGLRYGLAMAALFVAAKFLIYYAVEPIPEMLVAKQIIFDSIGVMVMGVVLALVNK